MTEDVQECRSCRHYKKVKRKGKEAHLCLRYPPRQVYLGAGSTSAVYAYSAVGTEFESEMGCFEPEEYEDTFTLKGAELMEVVRWMERTLESKKSGMKGSTTKLFRRIIDSARK